MKKGFTLAEVLITLAVIGVVAALTIPVLVQKYQKKQLYTQFMKTYNTLTTAMDNAVAEYGEAEDWNWGKNVYNEETHEDELVGGDDPANKYIFSSMKVVKKCDEIADCFASDYSYLQGGDGSSEQYPDDSLINNVLDMGNDYHGKAATLADGAVIAVGNYDDGEVIMFWVDTNGKKGPNVYGRDLFSFYYRATENTEYNKPVGFDIDDYDPEDVPCNKDAESNDNGEGCVSRLLQEGKMNY